MKRRNGLFECMDCPRRDFCPIGNRPLLDFSDENFRLSCLDLVDLYETFQLIGKRIKEKQEKDKKCGIQ